MSLLQPLITLEGVVAPLDRINVDTDAIIPKQFLRSIKRTGFGPYLFYEWRYLQPEGEENENALRPNNDFVLNQPFFSSASILLTRDNFGCGSSREHAVWALRDFGFRVVIGTSFADIFHTNCLNNGVLPIVLKKEVAARWFTIALTQAPMRLFVDLPAQTVRYANEPPEQFAIDGYYKERLIEGADHIALTLRHKEEIEHFERAHRHACPWLFPQ